MPLAAWGLLPAEPISPSAPVSCSGLKSSWCNTAVTPVDVASPVAAAAVAAAVLAAVKLQGKVPTPRILLSYRLVVFHHHKGRIRCCLHAEIHCKLLCWIHCWQLHLQSTAETCIRTAVAPGVPVALAVCCSMPNVHVAGAVQRIECTISKITNVENTHDCSSALITAHSVAAADDELFHRLLPAWGQCSALCMSSKALAQPAGATATT